MDKIGNQLKEARIRQELERERLALLTGLNVETIAAIEEGALDVQISTLYKLSDVLKCSFEIGDISI
ncbi:MAG: helix-turn-helix transcriptional regulator [Bacillota bacterium]|nr:helix-turn-helix transcriptional regulator [Bacillota bacterium]